MNDENKSKLQLVEELAAARNQIAELTVINNQLYQELSHQSPQRADSHELENYPSLMMEAGLNFARPLERKQRLLAEIWDEINLALISQVEATTILTKILRHLYRIVPYTGSNIALVEDEVLQVVCWQGYYGNEKFISTLQQSLRDYPLDFEAVQLNHPLIIPDTHKDPRWIIMEETTWIRACATIPISSRQHVSGLLRLDADTPTKFCTDDFTFLQPLANLIATVLEESR